MILSFRLSMPGSNAWDGKWSGSSRNYIRTRSFQSKKSIEKANQILDKGYFHYNFGDGWRAGVAVEEVDSRKAASLRRISDGFCGYDWMITSIISVLEIVTIDVSSPIKEAKP